MSPSVGFFEFHLSVMMDVLGGVPGAIYILGPIL
jgi:hypothetical protein